MVGHNPTTQQLNFNSLISTMAVMVIVVMFFRMANRMLFPEQELQSGKPGLMTSTEGKPLTEEQLAYSRVPIPYTPVKRLRHDDVLYVVEETVPHPIAGYAKAHKKYSIIDLRGYRRGYEPRLDIQGIYTPNTKDIFRLQDGHLPAYQPTTTGDQLLTEMRKRGVHKAFRIAPKPGLMPAVSQQAVEAHVGEHHSMWLSPEQRTKLERKYGTVAVRWAEEATRPGDIKAVEAAAEYYHGKLEEVLGLGHLSPELSEEQIKKLRELLGLPPDVAKVLKIHRETGYIP
jgi:hypothetical protein